MKKNNAKKPSNLLRKASKEIENGALERLGFWNGTMEDFMKANGLPSQYRITNPTGRPINPHILPSSKETRALKEIVEKIENLNKKITPRKTDIQIVSYNPITGAGYAKGEYFRFKNDQPEFFVFAEMYKNIGKSVPKSKILELCDKSAKFGNPSNEIISYTINDLVKKMRKRTGLNKEELSDNNGALTLVGKKNSS